MTVIRSPQQGLRAACTPHASKRMVATHAAQTTKSLPPWAGDSWTSKVVNVFINAPVINPMLKFSGLTFMRKGSEKKGCGWSTNVSELKDNMAKLEEIQAEIKQDLKYPDYYLVDFHTYGNLNWDAAMDVEAVTYYMAWRTFKDDTLSAQQAYDKLRGNILAVLKDYAARNNTAEMRDILDVGCSCGMSTQVLQGGYPDAQVMGLDASPHFIALAEYRERQRESQGSGLKRISYKHALAESTGLADASMDMVSFQFVFHECPPSAITDMLREAYRVVRPGGMVFFVDNDPRSETIQELPAWLFTMMKVTEPWSDIYYPFDIENAMRGVGLANVEYHRSDHRHRCVVGMKPL